MKRQFSKEETQMTNKYFRACLTSITTMKMMLKRALKRVHLSMELELQSSRK